MPDPESELGSHVMSIAPLDAVTSISAAGGTATPSLTPPGTVGGPVSTMKSSEHLYTDRLPAMSRVRTHEKYVPSANAGAAPELTVVPTVVPLRFGVTQSAV